MGLFSSSKSTSVTDASTSSQSADGLVNSQVINAGGAVTKIDEFSDNVAEFVGDVANKAISAATTSSENVIDTFEKIILGYQETTENILDFSKDTTKQSKDLIAQAAQPDAELVKGITKYVPVILITGFIIIGAVAIWKK